MFECEPDLLSESGSCVSPQYSPKLVKVTESGFFASWFKSVDPNNPIREDEYFWPSGLPLECDNWEDENDYFDYLASSPRELPSPRGLEPLSLSIEISDVSSEFSEEIVPREITHEKSDWSKMPPLLPPLKIDESNDDEEESEIDGLTPAPMLRKTSELRECILERQTSDWSKMPPLLPPLPSRMQRMGSDLSNWDDMPEMAEIETGPSAPEVVPFAASADTISAHEQLAVPCGVLAPMGSEPWLPASGYNNVQMNIVPPMMQHLSSTISIDENWHAPVVSHTGSWQPVCGTEIAPLEPSHYEQPARSVPEYADEVFYPPPTVSNMSHSGSYSDLSSSIPHSGSYTDLSAELQVANPSSALVLLPFMILANTRR